MHNKLIESSKSREVLYSFLEFSNIETLIPIEDMVEYLQSLPLCELTNICVSLRDRMYTIWDSSNRIWFDELYILAMGLRSKLTDRPLPRQQFDPRFIYFIQFRDGTLWHGNAFQLRDTFGTRECSEQFLRIIKASKGKRDHVYKTYNKHKAFYELVDSYWCTIPSVFDKS